MVYVKLIDMTHLGILYNSLSLYLFFNHSQGKHTLPILSIFLLEYELCTLVVFIAVRDCLIILDVLSIIFYHSQHIFLISYAIGVQGKKLC